MRLRSTLKPELTWMLGTASVLFASNAWADGVDSALGALFGIATALLVLGGMTLVAGAGTLFFNLTGRHGTASIALGLLLGMGTLRLGLWTVGEVTRDMSMFEWLLMLGGGGLVLLGAGEIFAAVKAMRAGRSQGAAPRTAQD